jgi:P27 family predicted phage terminase small subunit
MPGVKGRSGGQNRKSAEVHLLEGTFRADRHNANEPKPTAGAPSCPTWLDKEAKAEWHRLVPVLDGAMGILTVAEREILTVICQAWSVVRETTRVLEKQGRYQKVGDHLVPHPAVADQRAAWKMLKDCCAVLGLDPSSRTRLKGKPAPPQGISAFARNRKYDRQGVENQA